MVFFQFSLVTFVVYFVKIHLTQREKGRKALTINIKYHDPGSRPSRLTTKVQLNKTN